MTDQEANSIEMKIITAAIECLEKYGVQGTTNRVIANEAGINSAAINYYFRSKEVLIQKAMEKTMDNAFDWQDFAGLPGNTPQERCYEIFAHLLQGGLNYPGITRAHFYDLLISGDYNALVVKRINLFAAQLCDDLLERGLKRDRASLQVACAQIIGAVFMFILAPRLFQSGLGLDLTDAASRSQFLHSLIDKLL
jgi:AcrR family transcriptional regulator